jgi:hypothetical protein
MKINIPRYENGQRWWNTEDPGFDIDTDMYVSEINSIDDFLDIVTNRMNLDKLEEYNELVEEINGLEKDNKNQLKFYVERFKGIKGQFNLVTKEMPEYVKETYAKQFEALMEIVKKTIRLNKYFIIDNREQLLEAVDNIRNNIVSKMKEARAKANKKYYEKRKELMNSVEKPKRTAEEIKEAQAKANKKSYEKRKALLNIKPKEEKTPEEIKEQRRETNRKYYLSKKELLNKIKLLEGVSSGANESIVF